MDRTLTRLADLAAGQDGIVSRRQIRAAGIDDDQLLRRIRSGVLTRIGSNAFRLVGAPITPRSDLRALVLDIGGDVVASRSTAAALHGFDGFVLRPPFDVTIGRGRNVSRVGHRVHTAAHLGVRDRSVVDGMPVTSAARTLVDLARSETPSRLTAALDSSLRDRLVTEDSLHRRIVALRGPGRTGIQSLLRVLEGAEVTRGGHSWLEREFLRLVAGAGLPRPHTQVELTRAGDRIVRVDARFPGTDVVVEVLGYRFHRTREQMARDTDRMNALLADGFRPFQFTYTQVVEQPAEVVATLRQALDRAA